MFFSGFSDELLKIAAMTVKQNYKPSMSSGSMLQDQKQDPSPIASAARNTGINTPAGQPEMPRGKPASTLINPQQAQPSKAQSFKVAK